MRQLTEKKKLSDRERRFSELCQQFSCTRPGKLLAFHQITEEKFKTLQMSIVFFLQSCLSNSNQRPNPSKEGSVVADFFHRIDEVENITPNGKIMPKPHHTLSYNLFLSSVANIIKDLKIGDLIGSFNVPTLRYKEASPSSKKLSRQFATEKAHMEAWVGHSNSTITFHMPIFGDIDNNFLQLFYPPDSYEESWAKRLTDFDNGKNISNQYIKADIVPEKGKLYIFDAVSLHQTIRKPKAGPRISVEMMAEFKTVTPLNEKRVIKDYRMTTDEFYNMGVTKIFIPANTRSGAIEKKDIVNLCT